MNNEIKKVQQLEAEIQNLHAENKFEEEIVKLEQLQILVKTNFGT
jgi:tetratricopeptide (TPR) repeat protein